mmetsp:Transcript_17981/g.39560  ORF Transcript_17981/g.39560 Transcript_17981/m.39560 type:complete len:149 (+) Transcript_17981:69-515(+)|eukprot:CAMPEP_0116934954 /NCGR_PEP_ID=MMETSP0467-20121206/29977_1 /TAXON_ID=283647 /ORGANISM="Mesodinium pulex, Strain SPMC105" /LENGTH=148 /DNA_ID=CAMNT_0004616199 /DNA_START=42 /DNA_END=488 /DNA_ORIENTATION=-
MSGQKKAVAKKTDAKKVAGALKKGSGRKATRVHTKVHFYKPKTLELARSPKVLTKSTPGRAKMDNYQILKYPLTTESAMKKIEDNNTLVFIVDVKANKRQIKNAVLAMHGVKAERVNTLIRPDGLKKAYVKLAPDCEALDIANKMGVI